MSDSITLPWPQELLDVWNANRGKWCHINAQFRVNDDGQLELVTPLAKAITVIPAPTTSEP